MQDKKRLAIFGSTGSIGQNTLSAIDGFSDQFQIEVLAANTNANLLIDQSKKYLPNVVVIANEDEYENVRQALDPLDIKVYTGAEAAAQTAAMGSLDLVVNAISGFTGLSVSIETIKSSTPLALANKESLVAAGEILIKLSKEHNAPIIPIDSEPSAIMQCLNGEFGNPIEKVIITASGGSLRNADKEKLKSITPEEALNHPVWEMGPQITIDSTTMINKGWEMLEAKWLFGLKPEQIDVVIHPEAVIHSMVQFEDGTIKAQMSRNDMQIPILYALNFPKRMNFGNRRLDLLAYGQFNFQSPDLEVYPNFKLAIDAMKKGGNSPCTLLASNEVAVKAFLDGTIPFNEIANINQKCLLSATFIEKPTLNDIENSYRESSELASMLLHK